MCGSQGETCRLQIAQKIEHVLAFRNGLFACRCVCYMCADCPVEEVSVSSRWSSGLVSTANCPLELGESHWQHQVSGPNERTAVASWRTFATWFGELLFVIVFILSLCDSAFTMEWFLSLTVPTESRVGASGSSSRVQAMGRSKKIADKGTCQAADRAAPAPTGRDGRVDQRRAQFFGWRPGFSRVSPRTTRFSRGSPPTASAASAAVFDGGRCLCLSLSVTLL